MQSSTEWKVAVSSFLELEAGICSQFEVGPVVARCLTNRGIRTLDQARDFLAPKLGSLDPPDDMIDLAKAARRTASAVMSGQAVAIFGDYDVDGLTSSALVYLFLNALGVTPEIEVADRFSGGYGLSVETVERMAASGCRLLIITDCGTSDHIAVERAAALKIDVVVVDHHRIESRHPEAYAFINPHRTDCQFADKNLCAAGLAFYFCAAVRTELVNAGFIDRSRVDLRRFLDLVALGTIADVVPLVGNNRVMASHGLRVMSEERRPGIEALLQSARIRSRQMLAYHVSYHLAPRINAAGRLASARDALQLLISTNAKDAEMYAARLERFTLERREIEEHVTSEARRAAQEQVQGDCPVLVVAGENWHKGVLGIVAARLSEEFRRPAFIIGLDGNQGTGSARGQGQFNLYAGLHSARAHLVRFGGHRDAAGFTVLRSNIDTLREALFQEAREKWVEVDTNGLVCDATLSPAQLTPRMLQELLLLGPFGQENPEPVFNIVGLDVLSSRVVGVNHLKLELKTPSGSISAFGPRMAEFANRLPHRINVAAALTPDEWRGDGEVELRLVRPPISCSKDELL